MIKALSTHHNRTLTVVFLVICCAAVIAAGVVGIEDNAPGILLAFSAVAALILAFVHPWRTTKQFGLLLLGAVLCFVIFAILHNVFHGVAGSMESAQVLQKLLEGLGVVTFLLAILVCPPAAIVGLVGSVAMLVRNHHRPKHA